MLYNIGGKFMKKLLVFGALFMLISPVFAAGRSTVGSTMKPASRLVTLPASQVTKTQTEQRQPTLNQGSAQADNNVSGDDVTENKPKVNRDKERKACLKNNIGIGNTFVWASKNSNTSNYAGMVEDTENPENNVCFVLVGMRSEDPNISTVDIQPQYFEWGQNITCGSWVDEGKMKDRILDAKKKNRTLATIAGAVGGAGVGYGAMELFGNQLLENAGVRGVMGQKAYDPYTADWYYAKAKELEKKYPDMYNEFVDLAGKVAEACNVPANKPEECTKDDKISGIVAFCAEHDTMCVAKKTK